MEVGPLLGRKLHESDDLLKPEQPHYLNHANELKQLVFEDGAKRHHTEQIDPEIELEVSVPDLNCVFHLLA